jgi:hypothetical protein
MKDYEMSISLLLALKEKPDTPTEMKVLAVIVKELIEEVKLLRKNCGLTAEEIEELRKTYNK